MTENFIKPRHTTEPLLTAQDFKQAPVTRQHHFTKALDSVNAKGPAFSHSSSLIAQADKRPPELQHSDFDNLWTDPQIQTIDWGRISTANRQDFADWFKDGMPNVKEPGSQRQNLQRIAIELGFLPEDQFISQVAENQFKAHQLLPRMITEFWQHLPPSLQRPEALSGAEFDNLWNQHPEIRNTNWGKATSTQLQNFAQWIKKGFPTQQSLKTGEMKSLSAVAKLIGYEGGRSEMRKVLMPNDTTNEAVRPAEFRSKSFDVIWSKTDIKDFNWQRLSSEQRQTFASWINNAMPLVSTLNTAEAQQLETVVQALKFEDSNQMRDQLWTAIPATLRRPQELQGSEFDSLWSDALIRAIQWSTIPETERQAFADWAGDGMPVHPEAISNAPQELILTATRMGFDSATEMRHALWDNLSPELRRPIEFQNPALDAMWARIPIQNLHWSTLSGEQKQSFANWIINEWGAEPTAMSKPATTIEPAPKSGIENTALALGFSGLPEMTQWVQEAFVADATSLSANPTARPAEFYGQTFNALWESNRFKQNTAWSSMPTENRQTFADWVRADMPSTNTLRSLHQKRLNAVLKTLDYTGIASMRADLFSQLTPDLQRPAELQDRYFDHLWENPKIQNSNWQELTQPQRAAFASWVIDGMPTTNVVDQRRLLLKAARNIGFENITTMRKGLFQYLPENLRRPDALTHQNFDKLWQVKSIKNANWLTIPPQQTELFAQWVQNGLPEISASTEYSQKNLNGLARALGYDSAISMRNSLVQALSLKTDSASAARTPKVFRSEVFIPLWEQSIFRDFDWENASTPAIRQTFAEWINNGVPDSNELALNNRTQIDNLAILLNFGDATDMRHEIKSYLSSKSSRPPAFHGAIFDNLWQDSGFRDSMAWGQQSEKSLQTFADWVRDGMPSTAGDGGSTEKQILQIARSLGYTGTPAMRLSLYRLLPAELQRPKELQDASFDPLWSLSTIQNTEWAQLSNKQRESFAQWISEGMPTTRSRPVKAAALLLGYENIPAMRADLQKQLNTSMQDIYTNVWPAEFTSPDFEQLSQSPSFKNRVDWSTLPKNELLNFSQWVNNGIPSQVDSDTSQELLGRTAQSLGYADIPSMRIDLQKLLAAAEQTPLSTQEISDNTWPAEFTGPYFEQFSQDSGFRNSLNWSTLPKEELHTFVYWVNNGMPDPANLSGDQVHSIFKIASRFGHESQSNFQELREQLLSLLPTSLKRPQELQHTAFDALWAIDRVHSFNWNGRTMPERSDFANWVQRGMPTDELTSPSEKDRLQTLARDMGFEDLANMKLILTRQLPTELGGILPGAASRPPAFTSNAFSILWEHALVRDFDWQTHCTPQACNAFANWVNNGLPDINDFPGSEHIETTAIALGFGNVGEMRDTLQAYLDTQSRRPHEFQGQLFDTLWESPTFRDQTLWNTVPGELMQHFASWVQNGLPLTSSLGENTLQALNQMADLLELDSPRAMRIELNQHLVKKTAWPDQFTGPTFEALQTNQNFIGRAWIIESVMGPDLKTFIDWINSGLTSSSNIKDSTQSKQLTQVAHLLGYMNIDSMRSNLKSTISLNKLETQTSAGTSLYPNPQKKIYPSEQISRLAENYDADLTVRQKTIMLTLLEFSTIEEAAKSLRISQQQFTTEVDSVILEFRQDPEQFLTHDDFREFLFAETEYPPLLTQLSQTQNTPLPTYSEATALLSFYHNGQFSNDAQFNAWRLTPLTTEQYDSNLETGLQKLGLSPQAFISAMASMEVLAEADLNPTPDTTSSTNNPLQPGGPAISPPKQGDQSTQPPSSNANTSFSTTPFGTIDPAGLNPNGIIGDNGSQAGQDGNGGRGNAPTAVAAPGENNPFSNSIPEAGAVLPQTPNVLIPGGWQMPAPGELLNGIFIPDTAPAPEGASSPNSEPAAGPSISYTPESDSGGVTIGGQLGSKGEAEKANTEMEQLLGKGSRQGVRPDLFPTPIDNRIPGFGEGVPPADASSNDTSWGLPDEPITLPESEGFPETDPVLDQILNPNGVGRPQFTFPPIKEGSRIPEVPAEAQAALTKALPELQGISYAQFSQLSAADQQQIIPRTLAYQQLAPNDKTNISLIDYLDSSKTSEPQRQQLSQLNAAQTVQQAQLNTLEARTGLDSSTLGLINARINALQANTAQINQQTQSIQQSNAARLSTLATQAQADPMSVAFIKPEAPQGTSESRSEISAPVSQNSAPIPRFMVVRTENGPKLIENLANGQSQLHAYPLSADTPITRQESNGAWSGVPDVGQIGSKLFLDLLFTNGALKMLNNGNPVQAPNSGTPQQPPVNGTPQTPAGIPQPGF